MVTSVVTLTLHSVIPGRRGSGEPGIPRLRRGIPGSPFGRPGMTLSESDVGDITLASGALCIVGSGFGHRRETFATFESYMERVDSQGLGRTDLYER
jgi:hypothetical protein